MGGCVKVGPAHVEVTDVGLRTIAVVLLAALAGWLIFRAVTTRRVPWISLGLVALFLLPLLVTERQWVSAEHEFSAVAKSYQPISQGVHCQRLGESFTAVGSELGHVAYDENGMPDGPAFLSYDTCNALAAKARPVAVVPAKRRRNGTKLSRGESVPSKSNAATGATPLIACLP